MSEETKKPDGSESAGRGVATDAVAELSRTLRSGSNDARTQAWFECGPMGAPALGPLVTLWSDAGAGLEVQRAARHGAFQIVRLASRPEASETRDRVITELHRLVEADGPPQIRRELLWLLSEIASEESLPVLSRLLGQDAVREEACMTLERMPGEGSIAVLEKSLAQSPAEFKPVLAAALARRGRTVSGAPSRRLVPRAQTPVQPLPQE